jgi:hypothetical protein
MPPPKGKPGKIGVDDEEDTTVNIVLRVHTTSREDFKITMGVNDEEQVNNILSSIVAAFNTIVASKAFVLTDIHGGHYIFNTDNITGVEIMSGP